jgi:hypothetical protein
MMNINLRFYKEITGEWFVDLPGWTGDKMDLQMVIGADTMLDILAQGENEIKLTLSTDYTDCETVLELDYIGIPKVIRNNFGKDIDLNQGATYKCDFIHGIEYNLTVWLCDVTKFVFGNFPDNIYIY